MRNRPNIARQSADNANKENIRVNPSRERSFIAVDIAFVAMGVLTFIVYEWGFKTAPSPVKAGTRVDFGMLELKGWRRKLEALNSSFCIQESHITLTEAQRDRVQFEVAWTSRSSLLMSVIMKAV
jgi:hypothetical protein